MPKHDEPITMAEHDAREKAEHLARLTTGDEAKVNRKAEYIKAAVQGIGRGGGWCEFKLSRVDRTAIVTVMPANISARDKVACLRQIVRASNSYCHDARLLDGERNDLKDRIKQLKAASTKLKRFFEQPETAAKKSPNLGQREKVIHREIFDFLEQIYAADPDLSTINARKRYWRDVVDDNLYEGVCALADASDLAMQALKRKKGQPRKEAEAVFGRGLDGIWREFAGKTPNYQHWSGEPSGPFPNFVRAVINMLPDGARPASIDGFIRRICQPD